MNRGVAAQEAQQMLASPRFLESLRTFDATQIPAARLRSAQAIVDSNPATRSVWTESQRIEDWGNRWFVMDNLAPEVAASGTYSKASAV